MTIMKTIRLLPFVFYLVLSLSACKEDPKKSIPPIIGNGTETLHGETSDAVQESLPGTRLFVIAPNGLSLREENKLDSEKLTVMPLGSEVVLLETSTETPLEVEYIKGGMHKINFEGQVGFAFSGYLSPVLLHQKDEATEAYITRLKNQYPKLRYESKPNNPDFHEGFTDIFTLPAASWHEAYYLVSAMYNIPKSLGFPNPVGPNETTIENAEKSDTIWDSGLTVMREADQLKKIIYYFRTDGFGYSVDIVQLQEGTFEMVYIGFVD